MDPNQIPPCWAAIQIGVNFSVSSLFLTETNLVPSSKLCILLRVNADTQMGRVAPHLVWETPPPIHHFR